MAHPLGPTTTRLVVVALAVGLTGCGGGGGSDTSPKSKVTPSSTPTPSPKATMFETCAKVETVIRKIGWPMVPTAQQADQLMVAFHGLAEAGDEQSKTALTLLRDPIDAMVVQYPTPGEETIKASQALDDGLLAFMDRCLAVGSTALE